MGWKLKIRNATHLLFLALVFLFPFAIALSPVAIWVADFWWLDWNNRATYRERKPHLEAIVQKLDKEVPEGNWFFYAYSDRPEDVKRLDHEQVMDLIASDWALVSARREGGHLRVEFRTYHRGRLGVWSLNYSSRGRTDQELERKEHPRSVTRLDANWWAAVFAD